MLQLHSIAESFFSKIGNRKLVDRKQSVDEFRQSYVGLSDSEIQEECKLALEGKGTAVPSKKRNFLIEKIYSLMLEIYEDSTSSVLRHVALGVEAFSRKPADLPAGSTLHSQQISAAAALTQRYILQMDTGEGKTYALLPAAFALACKYGRVYILCANEYLARRDASRTADFWKFVGVDVGLGFDDVAWCRDERQWGCSVVYTTLSQLIFRGLRDEIDPFFRKYPIQYSSVVLDDADATLLDEASRSYILNEGQESRWFDWGPAFDVVKHLEEDVHIEVRRSTLYATLTVDGEALLREHVDGVQSMMDEDYLDLRVAVENAYLAARVVEEGVDYIVVNRQVVAMDRSSGRPQPGVEHSWIAPLEFSKGFPCRSANMYVHKVTPSIFLNDFQHVAGLSGTITGDATEYIFTYHLWTAVIPPRRKRRTEGELQDVMFKNQALAFKYLGEAVLEALKKGRPVFVGTQTINDAEAAAAALLPLMPETCTFRVLTGKNEEDMAECFDGAGQSNSVLVATQLAGRGVDIRLSDEARANGGLALFGLSHALELRHDRQFLGRAGRHADPFTAQFICYQGDRLMSMAYAAGSLSGKLMDSTLSDGDSLEHRFLTKAIHMVQSRTRKNAFEKRVNMSMAKATETQIRHSCRAWQSYIQTTSRWQNSIDTLYNCSDEFIDYIIRRSLRTLLRSELVKGRVISLDQADNIVSILTEQFALNQTSSRLTSNDIEGQRSELAFGAIQRKVRHCLNVEIDINRQFHVQQNEDRQRLADLRSSRSDKQELRDAIEELLRPTSEPTVDLGWNLGWELLHDEAAEAGARDDEADARVDVELSPLEKKVEELNLYLSEHPRARVETALKKIDDMVERLNLADKYAYTVCERRLILACCDMNQSEAEVDDSVSAGSDVSDSGAVVYDEAFIVALNEKLETSYALEGLPDALREADARIGGLDEGIRVLDEQIEELSSGLGSGWEQNTLTPRSVAAWTFRLKWKNYLIEYSKIQHEAQHASGGLDYARFVTDRIGRSWTQIEDELAVDILRNLFLIGRRDRVLKLYSENKELEPRSLSYMRISELVSQLSDGDEEMYSMTWDGNLAEQFLQQYRPVFENEKIDMADARHLLTKFSQQTPTGSLQTSDRVLAAMKENSCPEPQPGAFVMDEKVQKQTTHLFLSFLQMRGLIAKLPSIKNWFQSLANGALATALDRSLMVSLTAGVGLIVLLLLMVRYGNTATPIHLNGLGRLMDDFFCAGWLRAGNIAAPAMGILVVGLGLLKVFFPNAQSNLRGVAIDKAVVPLLQVLAAIWMSWPSGQYTVEGFARGVVLFVIILAVCWFIQRLAWGLTYISGISTEAAWLCFTIPVVFLPDLLANINSGGWIGVFAVLVLVSLLWKHYNRMKLSVISLLSSEQRNGSLGKTMTHTKSIYGETGPGGHVIGVLLGWQFCSLWNMQGVIPAFEIGGIRSAGWVAVFGYMISLLVWDWIILDKRLSPRLWQQKLNADHLVAENCREAGDFFALFAGVRKVLRRRQVVFHCALVLVAAFGAGFFGFMENGFPIVIFFMAATFLFSYCAYEVATTGYRHFFSRKQLIQSIVNVEDFSEPDENIGTGWFARGKFFLKKNIKGIVGGLFFLGELTIKIIDWCS